MKHGVRPWIVLVCIGAVLLSLLVYFSRGSRRASAPEEAGDKALVSEGPGKPAKEPLHASGVEVSGTVKVNRPKELEAGEKKPAKTEQKWDPEIFGILPPRSRVMLENGSIVPAKPGRSKLGDPGVIAEIYDGAPEVAVKRLRGILLSGSNEYADFTRTEKYPEWVYDEIERRYPGDLGRFLAYIAKANSEAAPDHRDPPLLDIGDLGKDPYSVMLIGHPGEMPIAETRFGTVGAEVHIGVGDPYSYAVLLAHRIAAGDRDFHMAKVPPPGNRDLEQWARDHLGPKPLRDLEDIGVLPRRKNWHAAPGNEAGGQGTDRE